MDQRALGNSSSSTTTQVKPPREGRPVWVVTVYGISGLVLFGVMAYYLSTYLAR